MNYLSDGKWNEKVKYLSTYHRRPPFPHFRFQKSIFEPVLALLALIAVTPLTIIISPLPCYIRCSAYNFQILTSTYLDTHKSPFFPNSVNRNSLFIFLSSIVNALHKTACTNALTICSHINGEIFKVGRKERKSHAKINLGNNSVHTWPGDIFLVCGAINAR